MAFTFNQKVKTISKLIKEPKVLTALLSQRDFGYLLEIGWFESFLSNRSLDHNKKPIPWFSYPFIEFIAPRLNKTIILFEFGSGNSTLFFSDKVKKTISIEHNKEWFEVVNKSKPENVSLILTDSDSKHNYLEYFNSINESLDIIIVDGLHRNECIIKAVEKLSSSGVIILDDSERPEYKTGKEFILGKGFKCLDFWGIAPMVLFKKCTTVFYRSNNCLEI
jgi:hypothetical protein